MKFSTVMEYFIITSKVNSGVDKGEVMKNIIFKKRCYQNVVLYCVYFFIITLILLKFYFDYSIKLSEARFDTLDYYVYFIQWGSFMYMMITLLFLPSLMNEYNITLSTDGMDKFVIQRIGYNEFYKNQILKSFIKGITVSFVINTFIFVILSLMTSFNYSNLKAMDISHRFLLLGDMSSMRLLLYNFITQSLGFGLINVGLFTLTRFKVNKYLYYLSTIFVAVFFTTGTSAILSFISNVIPKIYSFFKPIANIVTVINPLTFMFPMQSFFTDGSSGDLHLILSLIMYSFILIFTIKYKIHEESKNG